MAAKDIDIKEIYEEILEKRIILSELFSKTTEKGVPLLAVYDAVHCEEGFLRKVHNYWRVQKTLEFFPDKPSTKVIDKIVRRRAGNNHMATYEPDFHIITMNRQYFSSFYDLSVTEEVMHCVVDAPQSRMDVPSECFNEFNCCYPGFGIELYRVLKHLKQDNYEISLNEFFPPLAQLYFKVLGRYLETGTGWIQRLDSIIYFQPGKPLEQKIDEAEHIILHLPRAAGLLLGQQYHGDIKALLREHPSLPHLSGPEIWEHYCKPLLMHGKL
ncbi:MAG: hypothetical protein KJ955_08305 [Nanoarchaeota archaeon]|nr:hypothetical protein [Nanoarchaeota archaeon]